MIATSKSYTLFYERYKFAEGNVKLIIGLILQNSKDINKALSLFFGIERRVSF